MNKALPFEEDKILYLIQDIFHYDYNNFIFILILFWEDIQGSNFYTEKKRSLSFWAVTAQQGYPLTLFPSCLFCLDIYKM